MTLTASDSPGQPPSAGADERGPIGYFGRRTRKKTIGPCESLVGFAPYYAGRTPPVGGLCKADESKGRRPHRGRLKWPSALQFEGEIPWISLNSREKWLAEW